MVMMTKWRIEPHFVAVSSLSSAPQTHKGLLLLTRSVMPYLQRTQRYNLNYDENSEQPLWIWPEWKSRRGGSNRIDNQIALERWVVIWTCFCGYHWQCSMKRILLSWWVCRVESKVECCLQSAIHLKSYLSNGGSICKFNVKLSINHKYFAVKLNLFKFKCVARKNIFKE